MLRQISISAIILAGLVAAAMAGPTLDTGGSVVLGTGQTIEIPITLTGADAGISGYNITLALGDPAVAEITGLTFPEWASLHTAGPTPADMTWMQAVDLAKQAEAGNGTVVIGTVTIRGDMDGQTDLLIQPVQVQNDNGENYQIEDLGTEILIGATNSGSSSSDGGSSVTALQTDDTTSPTTPVPTATIASQETPETSVQTSATTSSPGTTATTEPVGETTPKPAPLSPVLMVAVLAWLFWIQKKE